MDRALQRQLAEHHTSCLLLDLDLAVFQRNSQGVGIALCDRPGFFEGVGAAGDNG